MRFILSTKVPATAILLSSLAGCTVGPDYKGPAKRDMPGTYASLTADENVAAAASSKPSAREASDASLAQWWTTFSDPTMDSLIQRAIAGNHDLRVAEARVREARALRGVERSALFPTVGAVGGASRTQQSQNNNNGFPALSGPTNLFEAGLDAAWEIDVFGAVRRSVEAADADLQAADELRRDVLVSLIAEVARNYVELRGFQQRIDLNDRTVLAQRETLELTQSLSRAGISSDLQVEQSAAVLASRESQSPPLHSGLRIVSYRLSVLLGEDPGSLLRELGQLTAIPTPPAEIPVGLPSELLRRRPDIRQAERNLAASSARIGVATADLFPRFSITGSFGLQSSETNTFFNSDSQFWGIGPAVRWNVFDAGRTRSRINAANAREEQAAALYEKAILTSLEDVENSLTTFVQEQLRRQSLIQAVQASERALNLATDRYKSGIGDFLNVLDAQRGLYELQDQLVQSEIGVTRGAVAVYKALGGGWDIESAQQTQKVTANAQANSQPQDEPAQSNRVPLTPASN